MRNVLVILKHIELYHRQANTPIEPNLELKNGKDSLFSCSILPRKNPPLQTPQSNIWDRHKLLSSSRKLSDKIRQKYETNVWRICGKDASAFYKM